MKTNENKFQKCHAALLRYRHTAWMLLRKCLYRGDGQSPAITEEPPAPSLNPLERITEHLRRAGLGQLVRVRFEVAGGDYILEDADGFVHAKDYDQAVLLVERIWLYRP